MIRRHDYPWYAYLRAHFGKLKCADYLLWKYLYGRAKTLQGYFCSVEQDHDV